jgi:hypothetical protein
MVLLVFDRGAQYQMGDNLKVVSAEFQLYLYLCSAQQVHGSLYTASIENSAHVLPCELNIVPWSF